MQKKWLAALCAWMLLGVSSNAMAQQQPKDRPAAENKQNEPPKTEAGGQTTGQGGQPSPSGGAQTGSSDNADGGAAASGTSGGFSTGGRLTDPSPNRATKPGGQF